MSLWWRSTRSRAAMLAEIERLLADGQTVAAVHRFTGVAESTIRAHRAQIRGGRRNLPYGDAHHVRSTPGTPLTRREVQVLARLLAIDEPTQVQAAADLGLTVNGVQHALTRIYGKLAVRSLVGAQRVYLIEQDRLLLDWRSL